MMWLLNAEVYPLRVRGKAAGLGTSANWVANFAVSMTFPILVSALLTIRAKDVPLGPSGA